MPSSRRVHDAGYIAAVVAGTLDARALRRIGFPWSPAMVERSRRSAGATLAACRSALAHGCGINLAGGTHHAHRDFGAGFCVFNDAAVADSRACRRSAARCACSSSTSTCTRATARRRSSPAMPATFTLLDARPRQLSVSQGARPTSTSSSTTAPATTAYLATLRVGARARARRRPAGARDLSRGRRSVRGRSLRTPRADQARARRARPLRAGDAARARRAGGDRDGRRLRARTIEDIVDIHFATISIALELFAGAARDERPRLRARLDFALPRRAALR